MIIQTQINPESGSMKTPKMLLRGRGGGEGGGGGKEGGERGGRGGF